jgi:hypothetical protein
MDMIVEELENWIQEEGYPLVFNRHRKVGEATEDKWIRATVDIKGMNRWAQLALLNLLEETKLIADACDKKHGWGLRELQTLLNKPVKPTKVERYASAPLSNDELANMSNKTTHPIYGKKCNNSNDYNHNVLPEGATVITNTKNSRVVSYKGWTITLGNIKGFRFNKAGSDRLIQAVKDIVDHYTIPNHGCVLDIVCPNLGVESGGYNAKSCNGCNGKRHLNA